MVTGTKEEILQAATQAWETLVDLEKEIDRAMRILTLAKGRINGTRSAEVSGNIRVDAPKPVFKEPYNESDTMP